MRKNMPQMQNGTKSFGGREILHGMNLSVERGIIYGLLGVNGAGKSTAVKMVTGLLRPTEGEITFSGTSVFGHEREIFSLSQEKQTGSITARQAIFLRQFVKGFWRGSRL